MSQRLRRFLHLEKPRSAPGGPTASVESGRFAGVEPPAKSEPRPSPPPPATADRFREPQQRPLDITERDSDAQPFSRCASCEMDNTVYATSCQNCGADLTTPEQRGFNQRLWTQRREEASREEAEQATRELAREQQATADAHARRAMAEELARREGQRVRDELEGTSAGDWNDSPGGHVPWGIRLLGLIANPALRMAAVAIAVGLPILLIVLGGRSSGLRLAGLLILVVLAVLFSPNHRYYRHRRWWWWS